MIDGFSKRYAMTGFRLGYLIAPEGALRPLQVMQQNLFISASEFVQHAGLAAVEAGGDTLRAMRKLVGLEEVADCLPWIHISTFSVRIGNRRTRLLGGDPSANEASGVPLACRVEA